MRPRLDAAQAHGAAGATRHPPVIVKAARSEPSTCMRTAPCPERRADAKTAAPAVATIRCWIRRSGPRPRLAAMDAQGIDVAVLSINPNWYDVDRELAAQVISVQNERIAGVLRVAPGSLRRVRVGRAAVSRSGRASSSSRAMKKLGLRGAAIGGSVAGEELSDPKFHPFWAKAEELGAVVFIHPQGVRRARRSG